MKLVKSAIVFSLIVCAHSAFADQYIVQIAAYGERVKLSHFSEKGIAQVQESLENKSIWKYYVGTFGEESAAQTALSKIKSNGFSNARIINVSEMERLCAESCTPYTNPVVKENLRNIFFDFDKSTLRSSSRMQLDKLSAILKANSSYSAEIHAHTDAKGSDDYNKALSQRRQNSVKSYLETKGISSTRMIIFAHGENIPIAANEKSGIDNPVGRQFNRRVEIVVKDANKVVDIVEEIFVDEKNKIN